MFKILKNPPKRGFPRVFVTIHHGIGGWNSSIWGWTKLDDGELMADGARGFYEPLDSGFTNTSLGSGTRKDAIREAKSWAQDEDLPLYIPGE